LAEVALVQFGRDQESSLPFESYRIM